jgi:glutathione synthase/RimK-type ligase-like ATP-grasp enzyme
VKKILVFSVKNDPDASILKELTAFNDDDFQYTFASLLNDVIFDFTRGISISVKGEDILNFDLVYFRTWFNEYRIATSIAHYLTLNKKKVVDSCLESISSAGIHKLFHFVALASANFPIPKSFVLYQNKLEQNFDDMVRSLGGYPLILKKQIGRKGKGIFKLESKSDFLKIKSQLEPTFYFVQEFIPNSFDYRILVMGKKVVRLKKRIRDKVSNEFRNNVSLGANVELLDIKEHKDLCHLGIKASNLLGIDISGVDVVVSEKDKKPYILEINPAPVLNNDITQYSDLNHFLRNLC